MREIKVIHEYPKPPGKGWFERHQLLIMFILTTIGGGAISTIYQVVSHSFVQKREQAEADRQAERERTESERSKDRDLLSLQRKTARDFLIEFQESAEKRNFYAFRVISHIQDIQRDGVSETLKEHLKEDRVKYRNACEAWNLKRHFYERFLEFYVSPDLRRTFYDKNQDTGIVPQFIELGKSINQMITSYDANMIITEEVFSKAKNQREQLSSDLADLYDELLRMSMETKVSASSTGK